MPLILEPEDFEHFLWEECRTVPSVARRAITAYREQNMDSAETVRRREEALHSYGTAWGYPLGTVRRIVHRWREGIDFYEDLMIWEYKRSAK